MSWSVNYKEFTPVTSQLAAKFIPIYPFALIDSRGDIILRSSILYINANIPVNSISISCVNVKSLGIRLIPATFCRCAARWRNAISYYKRKVTKYKFFGSQVTTGYLNLNLRSVHNSEHSVSLWQPHLIVGLTTITPIRISAGRHEQIWVFTTSKLPCNDCRLHIQKWHLIENKHWTINLFRIAALQRNTTMEQMS